MTARIGIVLFDGTEELDWEVLSDWSKSHPEDDVEVFTVGQLRSNQVRQGLRVPCRPLVGLGSRDRRARVSGGSGHARPGR
jgi:hypothetical protein